MGEYSYGDFIDTIIRPPILTTFRKDQVVRVKVQGREGTVEEFVLDDMYPFHTVGDLCTRIYIEKGERDEFHPVNQCILISSAQKDKFIHLQYLFNGTSLLMINPYQRMVSGPDPTFVDLTGNIKVGSSTSRNDMLLENVLFLPLFLRETEEYVIHLFLYTALLSAYPGERPISRIDWEGKFKPYFPEYIKEYEGGSVPDAVQQFTPTRVERFQERLKVIVALNDLLESKPLRIIGEAVRDDDVNVSNIRNLRIGWKGLRTPFQLEGLFYDIPVGELIPYVRFYPKANTPISKLYVEGEIPKMDDPTVLTVWAGMRSITPQEDLLMIKVLVKRSTGTIPPVYGTFFIFEDGSAKFILQPSVEQKSLSGDVDLAHLSQVLERFFSSFPRLQPFVTTKEVFEHSYTPRYASLEDAYLVLSLWVSLDAPPLSYKRLSKVMPYFRAFFQETSSPIKEQRPIMFLRYKCVNDFRTPSRESQYLQRIIDLQKVAGRTSVSDMEKYFKDEFGVTDEVSKERVGAFLADMTKFAVVNPEVREVTQKENPGIDIAIFGKHPFYTFHIYRVDSLETLQRIKTLLSLFVSVVPSDLSDLEEAVEVLEEEEAVEKREAEEGTEELAPQALETPGEGDSGSPDFDAGFELDALGELPEFDEESEALHTLVEKDSEEIPQRIGGAGSMAAVAAPAAPIVARGTSYQEKDESDEEGGEAEVSAKTYFSRRLRKYDLSLFKYPKEHKSTKSYPQQCQANALKQPVVLNEGEFKRMKELYKPDVAEGRLQWIEYPLKDGTQVPAVVAKKKGIETEKVSVLRYGTNLDQGKANIYTCSELWCIADELVILRYDFMGTRARDIRTGQHKEEGSKPANTCPFCKRRLVRRKEKISTDESVIQRTTPKAHTFIGFLGKGSPTHPKGFHLPCCFLKDKVIYTGYAAYKDLDVEEERATLAEISTGPMTYDYSVSESKISNKRIKTTYITGPDKLPLEFTPGQGPQIGVLPPQADVYFSQVSNPDLVKQDHTFWKIMTDNTTKEPSVSGFFRVAVENRGKYEADSFFAAVAPFYGYTGADALKERLYEVINPIVFMSLNYGNFLFEFYDPAFEIDAANPLSKNNLLFNTFAFKLGIKTAVGKASNKEEIIRGMRGYLAFKGREALDTHSTSRFSEELGGKLFDRNQLKESRQFYSLFTYPNMLTWTQGTRTYSNGVMFIILEIGPKGTMQVKCPPYGVSPGMAERCDVGFLLHYKEDRIWEPVFYTHNNVKKGEHYTTFIFTRDTFADWPEIVKERVAEFSNKCKSTGLGMYTESPDIKSSVMIPLSKAKELGGVDGRTLYAVLRDSYNHVSAVLFQENGAFIFLPVVDDGSIYQDVTVELSWRHFLNKRQIAKADVVEKFYRELDPFFATLPPTVKSMYERGKLFSLDKTAPAYPDLYAFHLNGGLFVPVLKPDVLPPGTEVEKGDDLPWMIDSKIAYTTDTKRAETFMDSGDFEEIYQHLRYTFANWLSTVEGSVLGEINEILYDADGNTNLNYSIAEKRNRIFIKIGRTVLSWLDSSLPQVDRKPTLKRMDCRILRDAETCTNRCVWKGESSECLIHIPKEYIVGRESVAANAYMVKRIIEELVRFPLKRKELLSKRVRQYVTLRSPFKSGNSYIIPENLPQWTELLRMEWLKKKVEVPKHFEEFAWSAQTESNVRESEELPEELEAYLGAARYGLFFISQLDGLKDGYIELGIPSERAPEGFPSSERLIEMASILRLSMFQMEYEYDTPIPKDITIVSAKTKGMRGLHDVIVSVKLPDTTVGFLSTRPDRIVAIPVNRLSAAMVDKIKKNPLVVPV
jgi:hypothetical protein